MGDASKNNSNDVASYFKRNEKRPRTQLEDTTGEAYLSASENSDNNATPTASLTDLSDGLSDGLSRNGSTTGIPSLSLNGNSVSMDTVITSTQLSREKETLAFKLDKLHDKVGRYESHVAFLTKCIDNNVTPNGLRVYVEPSIGNRDDEFLQSWHDDLNEFSKKLTRRVIEYSEKTVAKTRLEISETTEKLKALISEPAFTEIKKALTRNDNTRNNELTSRKNRKFYRLKYGERDREPERSGAQSRPQNGTVILSNRGHRGMNRPSHSDLETRNDNFRDNRNHRNEDRRSHNDSNRRETRNNRQAGASNEDDNERLLSVINNRNRKHAEATRNQASNTNNHNHNRGDEHLHELISRRNSRSNLRQERSRATEDRPREIQSRNQERDTRPRDDRNRPNEDRDVQIRALHQKIEVLERETRSREDRNRNNDDKDVLIQSLHQKIEVLERRRIEPEHESSIVPAGSKQKNDQGAQHQGPGARTLEEMQAYLADAMATISEFAKQLSAPTASTPTHSDK